MKNKEPTPPEMMVKLNENTTSIMKVQVSKYAWNKMEDLQHAVSVLVKQNGGFTARSMSVSEAKMEDLQHTVWVLVKQNGGFTARSMSVSETKWRIYSTQYGC